MDTSADGASEVTGVDNLDDCLEACNDDDDCMAVEYSDEFGCWMHTADDYEDNIKDNTGVTLYKFQSCGKTSRFILA